MGYGIFETLFQVFFSIRSKGVLIFLHIHLEDVGQLQARVTTKF